MGGNRSADRLKISIHAPRVGGDRGPRGRCSVVSNFNPRPPCGGRLQLLALPESEREISIHAPRVGGDFDGLTQTFQPSEFQSTPPVWGATAAIPCKNRGLQISIHAPRVGGDPGHEVQGGIRRISIHAPRVGGDRYDLGPAWRVYVNFNPRPPCGGRRVAGTPHKAHLGISIHAPRVGGDQRSML